MNKIAILFFIISNLAFAQLPKLGPRVSSQISISSIASKIPTASTLIDTSDFVAYWKFDGDLTDATWHNNDLTGYGSPTVTTNLMSQPSLSKYAYLLSNPSISFGTGSWTVGYMVQFSKLYGVFSDRLPLVSKAGFYNWEGDFIANYSNGGIEFDIHDPDWNNDVYATTANNILQRDSVTWNYVAFTYDADVDSLIVFVNDTLRLKRYGDPGNLSTNNPLILGGYYETNFSDIYGSEGGWIKFDNVYLVKRRLSYYEIATIKNKVYPFIN